MRTVKRIRLLTLIAFVIAALLTNHILKQGAGQEFNAAIGWIALASLAWCGLSMKQYTGTYFSLVFMFEVAFYILTMGQSALYAFGIETNSPLDLYLQNTASDVNRAYLYSILCLLALHFGLLSYSGKKKFRITFGRKSLTKGIDEERDYTAVMRKIAWLAFPFALVAYGYEMLQLFREYAASGYAEAFESISGTTSWGKLFSLIGGYFPTILFMLLASYRNDTGTRKIIIGMILVITLLNFALGNRSEPICYLMAVLWFMRRYAVSDGSKKSSSVLMVVVAVIIVLIIPIIGETRNTGELSLGTIFGALSEDGAVTEAVKDTMLSMGWSAFPLVKTMQIIPEQVDFHYGQSYFFAILAIFPNIFGGTHISVKYAGLPQWLMDYLNLSFGPGYSMPAEAYYNFGWLGIAVMPLLGWLLAKLLDERKKDESVLRLFVMLASFVILFSIPRREMLTAIRNITYRVGLLSLAVVLLGKPARHSENAMTTQVEADGDKQTTGV